MQPSKLAPLTPTGSKFLRYLLSFLVTLGVGIAPVWGGKVIPGFYSILDVYPTNLHDVIAFASVLMIAIAVLVQFLGVSVRPRLLKTIFMATFMTLIVLVLANYIAYKMYVIQIQVPASHEQVAYLVGSEPLATCECAKRGLEIRTCIGYAISVNPDEVAACFSRDELNQRSIVLSGLYIFVMLSFGTLIGLLILKEAKKPRHAAP
jgi:hypothetical protein